MLLTRGLPLLIELGLAIFALLECASTPPRAVRALPKGVWILLIVVFPFVGAIAWLVAGRPDRLGRSGAGVPRGAEPWAGRHRQGTGPGLGTGTGQDLGTGTGTGQDLGTGTGQEPRPLGPDDDPEFLRQLGRAVEQRQRDEDAEPDAR